MENKDSILTVTINSLLPAPQVIERLNGEMVLNSESVIYFNDNNNETISAVSRFLDVFEERYNLRIPLKPQKGLKDFQIRIKKKNRLSLDLIIPDAELKMKGDEAYEVIVHSNSININANSSKGIRWALMTLIQLGYQKNQSQLKIPAVKILDWPHYAWRGYMLDTGRAPYSIEQIKRTIRICSAFKLNFLMLREGDDELNAFKYDNLKLGHDNPFALNIKELSEIIIYGEEHGVVVFPEIESLGHAAAKRLHYPDLIEGDMYTDYWPGFAHMRKANLKVGDPGTYKLLESIYKELFPLLKVPMVHLGLDEVRLPKEKQAEHLKELLPIVDRTGKKHGHEMQMIVWSDAPPTPPEYHDRVIRCLWVYDDSVSLDNQYAQIQGIDMLTQPDCRQKVFISGGSGTVHQPYSKGSYLGAFRNLSSWTMLGRNYSNFIGILAVQWGTNIIDEWFPNFLMAAEFSWNVPDKTPDYALTMDRIVMNLQKLDDFVNPDPSAVDRPAWDGIWLNGKNWDEDIMTGQKAAPVIEIFPQGEFFFNESSQIELKSNYPQAKIYYTLDGSEPNQQSNFYYGKFQVNHTTTIRAKAFVAGRPPSYTATRIFASLDFQDPFGLDSLSPGIRYNFYKTNTYSVLNLVNEQITASDLTDKITIVERAEDEEKFGLIYMGYIEIQKKGIYTFHLLSNDGSKLYINNMELIDNDGRHGAVEKYGKIALKTGHYPIKVEYFQNGGGKDLTLYWSAEWFEKQEIPAQVLFHAL